MRHRPRLCITLGLLVVGSTQACGGSGTPQSAAGADTSTSTESQAQVCSGALKRSCLRDTDVQLCEASLESANEAFLSAFRKCVDSIVQCKSASLPNDELTKCAQSAVAEAAPGFPSVPAVTQCKDKDLACKTEYAFLCDKIPRLDGAAKARVEECKAKTDCQAFVSCLKEAVPNSYF